MKKTRAAKKKRNNAEDLSTKEIDKITKEYANKDVDLDHIKCNEMSIKLKESDVLEQTNKKKDLERAKKEVLQSISCEIQLAHEGAKLLLDDAESKERENVVTKE